MATLGSPAEEPGSHDRQTLFKLIRENVDGIVVVDLEGNVLFANPAALRLFGRTRESLVGSAFGAPMIGEKPAELEVVREGEPATVELRAVEIDWEGQPARLVSLRDITDRKRAEERLAAVTDRLMLALESSRLGIWSWTPDVDRLDVDPFITSLLGLPDAESPTTLGELLEQVVPDRRDSVRDELEEIFRTGCDFFLELPVRRPDGSIRSLEARGSVQLNAMSQPVRLLGTCWDATDRVGLEEQLRQAQKMEAVGHLAGGMAHDFNNLLTGVSGYTRLVRDTLPDDNPGKGDLTKVLQLSARGAELIQQLLAFSRQTRVDLEDLTVDDVVRDTMQLLDRLLGVDIEIRLELASSGATVLGDPGRLEQILVNLAINARDAMPEGGRLTIGTGEREFGPGEDDLPPDLAPGPYAYLTITDTGTGMEDDVQERIFEPFFTTKEVGSGSGLGLSTVFGIVRQHEGAIEVESAPGEGARFTIYLPRADGTEARPSTSQRTQRDGTRTLSPGDETILVVEDDGMVAEVARRVLEREGYRTLVTTDPDAAVPLFEEHADDVALVLLDVVMPRRDGPAIWADIADRKPEVKVLFMSGYFEARRDLGAPLIEKPFLPGQLARRVREVLGSS